MRQQQEIARKLAEYDQLKAKEQEIENSFQTIEEVRRQKDQLYTEKENYRMFCDQLYTEGIIKQESNG